MLGILLMNIIAFGLPAAYDDPTNFGGSTGLNLWVWRINSLLFEGTMRGLFGLLFGAGVLLFLDRHSRRNPGMWPADLYFRRTSWLIVFGFIDGYFLLWSGDILFYYGLVGMFLFVFRDVSPAKLVAIAVLAYAVQAGFLSRDKAEFVETRDAAASARAQAYDEPLTPEQHAAIEQYDQLYAEYKPSHEQLQWMIDAMRGSYRTAFDRTVAETRYAHTVFFYPFGFLDTFGTMILGMALFKWGVITAKLSNRRYLFLGAVSYTVGLAVNAYETWHVEHDDFSIISQLDGFLTYDVGRMATALGHLCLIVLFTRTGLWLGLQRRLAAVGQMALTNYLTHSVICAIIFTGAGFAMFGQWERYELYYIVAAIWVVQLWFSVWWLERYRYGPLEWVWRSLTYNQRQPLRRVQPEPSLVSERE